MASSRELREVREQVVELGRRVRRGVRLLNKRVPGWRRVLRVHADDFSIYSGDRCVLGTLEHFSALKKLGKTRKNLAWAGSAFDRGAVRLGIATKIDQFGFTGRRPDEDDILQHLWKAEFLPRREQ